MLKSRFRLQDLLSRVQKFDAPKTAIAVSDSVKSSAPPNPSQSPEATLCKTAEQSATNRDEVQRLLTRDDCLERIESVFQSKTLSGVVAQVIAMASSPRGEMSQLANLIARDPMLSARVLQTANSSAYASAQGVVTTISEAIRKIGCTSIRNIAAALAVYDCMPEASADGFNPIRCWQHSFAVAQLCEKFTLAAMPEQSGQAYLVGLCHDLGDIFVRTQLAAEYQQLIDTATRTGQTTQDLHGRMLGMTPAQMVSAVLKCMGLPDEIRKPIEMFHAMKGGKVNPIAQILLMADQYTNAAMLASSPMSEVSPISRAMCQSTVGLGNPPRPDAVALRAEVLSLTVSLAGLSRSEQQKLLLPMYTKKPQRVWIARETAISEFDPISLALESMAEISVSNRLPRANELEQFDALVMIAPTANTIGFTQKDVDFALAELRQSGGARPVFALNCESAVTSTTSLDIAWRTSVPLADLSAFIESLVGHEPCSAAA